MENKLICGFNMAWVGLCKSTKLKENGKCIDHQDKCSCGNLATYTCSHTGFLVCGVPHCENCKCNH